MALLLPSRSRRSRGYSRAAGLPAPCRHGIVRRSLLRVFCRRTSEKPDRNITNKNKSGPTGRGNRNTT